MLYMDIETGNSESSDIEICIISKGVFDQSYTN